MAASTYDVFLSHSGRDKDFVKELYRRLTRDGVRCFFDIESIGWGDNWVRALERALDECTYVVFILSPDFCNSEWVEVERTSSLADDGSGLKRKVRPLMLRPCRDLPTFPRFLRQIQAIDVSTGALFEQNYERICRELGGVPQVGLMAMDRSKLPPVRPLPERHWMPLGSLGDKFVGRVGAIWDLYDSLFRDSTTILQGVGVVAGTGGLGKTQLAIEYAHRFGAVYTGGVYWVVADRGLREVITRIGGAAGIEVDTKKEESEQLAQLWRDLNARHLPCLVILDNFPEDVPLRPYLPTTGLLHTLVTTRRQDLQQATVRLPVLSVQEGIQLLNSGVRDFGQAARPLAERLGGLPLALELAKSYLNYSVDLSVAALIEEMERQGDVSLLKEFASEYRDQLPSRHELDVASTFQLSWDIASESARKILRVMGELAPTTVPKMLLRDILSLPAEPSFHDELSKGLRELARLSLVEVSSNGDPVGHRLILAFARHRNVADDASPFDRCGKVLSEQMGEAHKDPDAAAIRKLEALIPHAEFFVSENRFSQKDSGALANQIGNHHRIMGRFIAARDVLQLALDSAIACYEPGDRNISIRQANLAMVFQDMGQLQKASHLLREALASDEKSFEAGHSSIARVQSNLALVLRDQGQSVEASELLRKALASWEKSVKPGDPIIAIAQSNLALALWDQRQFDEARELLTKALASDLKSFEPGHSAIARSQTNLALVLKDLGELKEARDLLRQALASDEKVFGRGHPLVSVKQSNLAMVLKDLGELEEARDLLRQALASDEKSFEPGHPSIAVKQSNLALVLEGLKEFDEARDLLGKSYAALLQLLGPDHPHTKIAKGNLDDLPVSDVTVQ